MKKFLLLLIVALQFLFSANATAAPCVTASLATYLSLGSAGCSIGSLSFTDFSLNGLSTGATDFPGIVVNPIGIGPDVGLDFTFTTAAGDSSIRAANVTAPNGEIYEDRIGFKVTGTTVQLNASTITLNGADVSGNGNVSAIQDLCIGGTFVDPSLSSACLPGSTPGSQAVVFISGVPDLTTSSLAFLPVMTLSVLDDIVVDAGAGGTAILASFSNRFSSVPRVVPEPDALLLIGAGLTALLMRRSSRRKSSSTIA